MIISYMINYSHTPIDAEQRMSMFRSHDSRYKRSGFKLFGDVKSYDDTTIDEYEQG